MTSRSSRGTNSEERWVERGADVERAVFFSDAVFAIAITLLALELRVPEAADHLTSGELASSLAGLWPRFFSFFISFWIVGSYWLAHHRHFHYIHGYDRGLLRINLLFLMWVVLLPFSSSVLGEWGDLQVAVVVYAANVALAGLTLAWLWRYASRDQRLLDASRLDPRELKYTGLRDLSIPTLFVASIAVSFVSVGAAEYSWLLMFLVRPLLVRLLWRRPSSRS